ncbi:unnamed protein product [Closterium sp. NIES-64]|nr:unnamed protein product [Closterium sp. NIES-64]
MSSPYDPRKRDSGAEEQQIERRGAPEAAAIAEDRGASARCSIDGGDVRKQTSGVNQPASRTSSGRSESRAEILPRSGSGSFQGETGLVRSASKGEDVAAHGNALALVPVGGGWGEMLNQMRGGAGGLMVPAAMAQESSDVVMGILMEVGQSRARLGHATGALSFFKLDGPDKAIVLHELQRRPGARLIGDEIRRYVRIERENGVLATVAGRAGRQNAARADRAPRVNHPREHDGQPKAEKVELETAVVDEKRQQGQPSSSAMLLGEEDDDADSTFNDDDGDDEGDDDPGARGGGGARKEPRLTSTVRDTDEDEGDTDSDCNDEFYEAMTEFAGQGMVKRVLDIEEGDERDEGDTDSDCNDEFYEAMTEFAGQGMVKRVLDIEEVGFSYPHVPRRSKLPDPEEEEKPLNLWSVLKECMGKDMFKVSLPVSFNEPLSSSQKYLEMLEYSWLLDRAAEYGRRGNRLMRAAHVAAFAAWHVDGTGWKFWGDVCPKIRFWGPSIQLDPVTVLIQNLILGKPFVEHYGTMRIKGNRGYSARLRFKERSTFDRKPAPGMGTTQIMNGKNPQQVRGLVQNEAGDEQGTLMGRWDQHMHYVRGLVQNEAGDEQGTLMGRWDQHVHYVPGDLTSKTAKEESEVLATAQLIWKKNPVPPNTKYKFTPFTITLNELTPSLKECLPPTDSRLREDQRALEEGRYDFANQEKCRLEQRQRKALKDGEPGWGPRWFKPSGPNNTWRYTGGYWERREKRDWSGVLDMFAPEETDGDADKA